MMDRFASCFHDERRPEWIEHEVATLVGQRVFGIALAEQKRRGWKPAVSVEPTDKPQIAAAAVHLTPGKLNAVRTASSDEPRSEGAKSRNGTIRSPDE
jgi:hypothetical protein